MKISNHNVIKIEIIRNGFSQKEIADKINISEATLSRWINGNLGNIDKFIKLCYLLNLNINDFIEIKKELNK